MKNRILSQNFSEMIGINNHLLNEDDQFNVSLFFAQSMNSMLEGKFIKFMSSIDLAYEYGHTRQYWDLLIKTGDIPSYSCGTGKFTLDVYARYYLSNKYGPRYLLLVKGTVNRIKRLIKEGKTDVVLTCPRCGEYKMRLKEVAARCGNCRFMIRLDKYSGTRIRT